MTNQTSPNAKAIFKQQKVIHYFLLMALIGFTGFSVYTGNKLNLAGIPSNNFYMYFSPLAAVICYFMSNYTYNLSVKKIDKKLPLQRKLGLYFSACVIRYALIEGAAFIALVAYLSESYLMYISIAVLLIIYFYAIRPTEEKLKKALELKRDEIQELQ